jgi:cytidylate kinase
MEDDIVNQVITIDGPSGAGKGTVAKLIAQRLGYEYLDTGALYRAVAWKARHAGIAIDDEESLGKMLREIEIEFRDSRVFVDGTDVSSEIRTAEIGELSSQVSAVPIVREALFELQREICLRGRVVIEGRDTGTTIFPEASHKFYLDADVEERARRRFRDLREKDPDLTLKSTIEDIKKRDLRDSTREHSPLRRTDEMIYIDSTNMTIDDVVEKMLEHVGVSSGG